MNTLIADLIIQKIESEMLPDCMTVSHLQKMGYTEVFVLSNNLLRCLSNNHCFPSNDFTVDQLYSLEDSSGSLEGIALFALRHRTEGSKGIFIGYLK